MNKTDIEKGAHNLLVNCAELQPDESLLILCEDPALGWYDAAAPQAIAGYARAMGIEPTLMAVGCPQNEPDPAIGAAINAHDCTRYFARLGDQRRLADLPEGKRSVMCYIRDIGMLASPAGTLPYGAFKDLKRAVDQVLVTASQISIVCPLGTQYSGQASQQNRKARVDVSVRRFPLGVHMPICASRFSGRVALSEYLTPTGSKCYDPPSVPLDGVSFAQVRQGRIVGFLGQPDQVEKIERHYDMVAVKFGIDRDVVHSWHGGIHPGVSYAFAASEDADRWSNTVFINPRVLHFHTCGAYAPAEISWMIFDATVLLDGAALWQDGQLQPRTFGPIRDVLENWPELAPYFSEPAQEIGL